MFKKQEKNIGEIIIYKSSDGELAVDVKLQDESEEINLCSESPLRGLGGVCDFNL